MCYINNADTVTYVVQVEGEAESKGYSANIYYIYKKQTGTGRQRVHKQNNR